MKEKTIPAVIILVILLVLIGSTAYFQAIFSDLVGTFEEFTDKHYFLGPVSYIALAAASVLLGPFTSAPLIPFAVSAWGVVLTIFYTMFGWLLGGVLSYAIGLYAGKPFVRWAVGAQRLDQWLSYLHARLNFWLLLLFRLAMPSETGYVFGLIGYDIPRYLLITALAEMPFALILVFAGDAFLQNGWTALVLLALVGIFIIAFAYREFMRRIRSTRAQ